MKYKFNHDKHLHILEKDGDERPLTGTSSVTGVISKPLTWWAVGLALSPLGWTPLKDKNKRWIPKQKRVDAVKEKYKEIIQLDEEQYLKQLDTSYYAHYNHMKTSAEAGTELHQLCEDWINGEMNGKPIKPVEKIKPLVDWSNRNVDKWLWSEVHCYSEEHWLGGISDAGFLDKEGRVGIMDFKSSKEAYLSQFIQCAGYDIQISENGGFTCDGEKVFDLEGKKIEYYAVLPFGMKKPEVQTRFNVDRLKEAFLSAENLYRLLNA